MAAQVKIHLYLENYTQAEKALKILIPFFQGNHIWKYRAESLFQMAMVEKARGREAESLRWTAEAIQAAEPWRYVRIFTALAVCKDLYRIRPQGPGVAGGLPPVPGEKPPGAGADQEKI